MKTKLNWFSVAIIVYMLEMNVSIFSSGRMLAENIGTNFWLGMLLLSLVAFANLFVISLVIRKAKGRSVFDILEASIPKPVLYPLYAGLIVLWSSYGSIMGKDYLLVFQLLAFPSRSSLVLLLLYGLLLYYLLIQSIYGMSKAITGFFFFVFWIPLLMLYFIPDWDYHRLTPYVFQDTRSKSSILAWAEAYQLFVGYELSLLLIPFCKKDGKWVKGLYIGQAMVCLTFIGANIIMAGYFSFDQLKKLTYPVISILSYVELPFLNRVEILSFTLFVFNNLSGTAMYSFAALLVLKRLFPSAKLKWLALGLVCYFLCLAAPIQLLRLSEQLHRCVNYIEIGFAFIGPFVLLFLLMTQRAARKGRAG